MRVHASTGCDNSSSEFLDIYVSQMFMLGIAAFPVFFIMPTCIFIFWAISTRHNKITQLLVARMPWLAKKAPHWFQRWVGRFMFSALMTNLSYS